MHLKSFEWVLNTSWMLLSVCEHLWVSIEHALNTFEYMWSPLRIVNSPWTPIECTWMPLSKYLEGWMHNSRVIKLKKYIGHVQMDILNIGINWLESLILSYNRQNTTVNVMNCIWLNTLLRLICKSFQVAIQKINGIWMEPVDLQPTLQWMILWKLWTLHKNWI